MCVCVVLYMYTHANVYNIEIVIIRKHDMYIYIFVMFFVCIPREVKRGSYERGKVHKIMCSFVNVKNDILVPECPDALPNRIIYDEVIYILYSAIYLYDII